MSRTLVALALALAAGAGAVGWYVYPRTAAGEPAPCDTPARRALVFPQSAAADAVLEKPAVAVDAQGRALLAWAIDTAADERTLYLARSADGGATFAAPAAFRTVA